MNHSTLKSSRKVHQVLVALLLVAGSTGEFAVAQRSVRAAETQRGLVGDTDNFELLPTVPGESVPPAVTAGIRSFVVTETQTPTTNGVGDSTSTLQSDAETTTLTDGTLPADAVEKEEVQDGLPAESQVNTLVAPTSSASSSSASSSSSSGAATELTSSGSGLETSHVESLKASTTTTSGASSSKGARSSSTSSSSSGSNESSSSGSGDQTYESGSSSGNKTYLCKCKSLYRVSLMGRSDYCLPKSVNANDKCGNVNLGTSGKCPLQGAQPCSPEIGYSLTKDSVCLLDEDANVYKCVASKEDFDKLRNYGKKSSKSTKQGNSTTASNTTTAPRSSAATAPQRVSPALHVVTLLATLALAGATLL